MSRPAPMRSIAFALMAGIAGLCHPVLAHAETVWELYMSQSVATMIAPSGLAALVERVDKETKGELKIKLHLGGTLQISVTNITPAVADNIVQIADDGFFQGNIPIGGILRLPMLIRNPDELAKAQEIIRPYMEAAYKKKGILLIGTYVYPFQVPFSRKKLTSLADIKGQKLRVTSPEQGEFVRRMGGSSVTIGTPEVPAAIDRGVIEGVFTAASGAGYSWRDLVKYNYRLPLNYYDSNIVVNQEAFEKLSPELQATLRRLILETTPALSQKMKSEDDNLTQKMAAENGLIVTEPTPAELVEATKAIESYWDVWAKSHGADSVEAVAKIRAALGR